MRLEPIKNWLDPSLKHIHHVQLNQVINENGIRDDRKDNSDFSLAHLDLVVSVLLRAK